MQPYEEQELEQFLAARAATLEEFKRTDELVKRYMKDTPIVTPLWDASKQSIDCNDINSESKKIGLVIYEAPFEEVWSGIYDPSIYDGNTLWNQSHQRSKIARVIENWENNKPLSPIFLCKHGTQPLALVADGKHRLTVARCMGCTNIPFMVLLPNCEWIHQAIPSSRIILNTLEPTAP